MVVDTIKTPFPATTEGECQLFERLGSFVRYIEDKDIIVLDGDTGPVLGIIVHNPDSFALADRIAAVVKGERLSRERARTDSLPIAVPGKLFGILLTAATASFSRLLCTLALGDF